MISLLPGGNRHDPHLAAETARALITTSASLLPRPCAHTRAAAATLLDLAESPVLARTPVNVAGT